MTSKDFTHSITIKSNDPKILEAFTMFIVGKEYECLEEIQKRTGFTLDKGEHDSCLIQYFDDGRGFNIFHYKVGIDEVCPYCYELNGCICSDEEKKKNEEYEKHSKSTDDSWEAFIT